MRWDTLYDCLTCIILIVYKLTNLIARDVGYKEKFCNRTSGRISCETGAGDPL